MASKLARTFSVVLAVGALFASARELPSPVQVFEPNVGQTDAAVSFLSRGSGATLFFSPAEVTLALPHPGNAGCGDEDVVQLGFPGASRHPRVLAGDALNGRSNYILQPGAAAMVAPHHGAVRYEGLYPGIDIVFYGAPKLEFDVEVAPGADPGAVRLSWNGVDGLDVDSGGRLRLTTRRGEVVQERPVAFQEIDGRRRPVDVSYRRVASAGGRHELGLEVGAYDRRHPLVIDPVLVFSTYLGGNGDDGASAVATDALGNIFVVGHTRSLDYPTAFPLQGGNAGNDDVFVSKLDPTGSALVFSTFLGGSGDDAGNAVAVDAAGSVYVAGRTMSTDFPVANAAQSAQRGGNDAFVAKLTAAGSSLAYATYLGGQRDDIGYGIAVNGAGEAVVVGATRSQDFPTVAPFQAQWGGNDDVFVTKFGATGILIAYSTYLGGAGYDTGRDVVFSGDSVVVTGDTRSSDFPVVGAFQTSISSGSDAFLSILDDLSPTLLASTFLGGSGNDVAYGVAMAAGGPVVVGNTHSDDFPLLNPLQATKGSFGDAFVTQFSGGPAALAWSTYLGGGSEDGAFSVDVDPAGTICLGGTTQSADFPVRDAFQSGIGGGTDGFLTRIAASGASLVLSTFVGGTGADTLYGLDVDAAGYLVAVGGTTSADFPLLNALQPARNAFADAFVLRLDTTCSALAISPVTLPNGAVGVPYSAALTASGGLPPYAFTVTGGALPPGLTLSGTGLLSGNPTMPGVYGFNVTATDSQGLCGSRTYTLTITGGAVQPGNVLVGQGLGQPNPNRVRIFRQDGTATATDFLAYAAGQWGVNVAGGDIGGQALDQILTGPGPGDVFGPQVRAFLATGTAVAKVNYFAYGTLRFGVNVTGSDVDGDADLEIVTGAGPGSVFGPHVRGWNYDGATLTAIGKISFFAYGTLKYGVNAAGGDVDVDAFDEIATGPGPGAAFGPVVRGWNYDASVLTTIVAINFTAFTYAGYGVNVASGDVDADGFDELAAAPGPGVAHPSRFAGFNYDGAGITSLVGFDVTAPTATFYGGRVGVGEITGDAREDLLTGAGRSAAADATVRPYVYTGAALGGLLTFNAFPGTFYGVNVDAGVFGF